MRRLLVIALSVLALLAPTSALAANPVAGSDREFVIQGLVYGGQKIEASGKLAILGASNLVASVGCNTIGGSVSVDGDHVTIEGPLAMTEMACPGVNGDTEAALVKVLALGSFTISTGGWFASGGAILAVELVSANPGGPDQSPPDYPGGVLPGGGPVPLQSCPPNQANGSGGGTGTGSGASGSSNGATGAGSGPTGLGTSGGGTTGSGGGVSSSTGATGSDDAGSSSAPAASAAALPAGTPAAAPGGEPGTGPGATPMDLPDATPMAVPPATAATEPAPAGSVLAVPLPPIEPVTPPIEPLTPPIAPVPGASANPNDCYAVPADALNAAGGPPEVQSGSGVASDLAVRDARIDTGTWPLLAVVLVLVMAGLGILGRPLLRSSNGAPAEDVTRP